MNKIFVFDPTLVDKRSAVRGIGRYLKILKENFPTWSYININNSHLSYYSTLINPFFNFLQPPLILKKIARKQIAIIHDLIPLKYSRNFPIGWRGVINIFLNKIALRNYDLIITDSYTSKKDIVNILKISESKVRVIYPCLSRIFEQEKKDNHLKLKIYKNKDFLSYPANFCLYVGDGTWNKNLVNLAKAIKIVNVTAVFVGKVFEVKNLDLNHSWQKELKDFLKIAKDDQRFIFANHIDDKQLLALYQNAQVNLLVSRDEGFGFSYLEAASQGCPSILSKRPIFEEISNDQGVIFADSEDPYDIADKIGQVYFNKKLKDKLGDEARDRSKFFNSDRFRDEFLKVVC